jgi:hypothetical protein
VNPHKAILTGQIENQYYSEFCLDIFKSSNYLNNGLNGIDYRVPLLRVALLRTITCWDKISIQQINRGLCLKESGKKSIAGYLGLFNQEKIIQKNRTTEQWSLTENAEFISQLYFYKNRSLPAFPPEGYQAMKERAKRIATEKKIS